LQGLGTVHLDVEAHVMTAEGMIVIEGAGGLEMCWASSRRLHLGPLAA